MPLISQILKDDQKLQACLVRDQDHVVQGAKGNHVAKIQKALLLLEKADIRLPELQQKLYGPSTAAAVLKYKTARKIINKTYQQTPDNVVGKMTIARLDQDLLALQRNSPDHTDCGGGSGAGGGVARLGVAGRLGVNAPPVRRLDARLRVIFQETTFAEELGGGLQLGLALFARAKELLAPHGIAFRDGLFFDFVGARVPDHENVIAGAQGSCFSVREAAERVLPGQLDSLRVIFCPFDEKSKAFGVTDGGALPGTKLDFPKFCLINVRNANPDQGTLVHEMIHAAKKPRVEHDPDAKSIYSEEQARTFLPANHAESIANAFYSNRRL